MVSGKVGSVPEPIQSPNHRDVVICRVEELHGGGVKNQEGGEIRVGWKLNNLLEVHLPPTTSSARLSCAVQALGNADDK